MLHDSARLAALQRTNLLDSPPEDAFDRLTKLACTVLHVPISLISLVDRERQFFKSVAGPHPWATLRETPLSHSFCQHLVPTSQPLVIADARLHALLHDNLAVAELSVVAYLGIPLISTDGQTLGSLCAIDTQVREWSEEEIDTLQELAAWATTEVNLRVTLQQLHAAEALRDDLTHMIVHDLRTPLSALLNGIRLLKSVGELNKKQQDVFHASLRSGNTLLKMINDVLDVSKLENESLPLECTDVSANILLENAVQQVQVLATSGGLTLTSEVAPDLPTFLADADKMLRTLVNLLSNAIKFTPQGGAISLSARLAEDEQGVVFAVSDTGEGIPQSELEHVFDKFAQVETRISGRRMSTGLGLTFCKLMVEAHGGHIWVESEVGKGSTFLFCIPIEPGTHV